ncbi:MAG: hypothetical protein WC156_05185 [Pedobacter sp.]
MQIDVLLGWLKQFRHLLSGKPDRFAIKPDIYFQFSVFSLINQKLALRCTLCDLSVIGCLFLAETIPVDRWDLLQDRRKGHRH